MSRSGLVAGRAMANDEPDGVAPIRPGRQRGARRVVGILGGGQLARMTALAAYPLGLDVIVLEGQGESPAGAPAAREIVGDWRDPSALVELAGSSDLVTLENEFVDAAALAQV